MRFVIYGAGAIGSVVGGHLAAAGEEVILIGRAGHINAVREKGLRLTTPSGTRTLHPAAVVSPRQMAFGPEDVVFLSVKSQHTDTALKDLHALTAGVPVFCFQNGVRNEEIATRYFSRVYGVRVQVGAIFDADGEVTGRTDNPGTLVIGRYPSGTGELAEAVGDRLRKTGFRVLVAPEVMPFKWGKLVNNLANAVSAITGAPPADTRHIIEAAKHEATALLAQAGVRWISDAEFSRLWAEGVTSPPPSRYQNSTWQSLTRQRGTVEAEFLNGEIVRLARSVGGQAPLNETLLNLVEEMAAKRETPGKFSVLQLSSLLRLA